MAFSVVLCNCPDPPKKLAKNTTIGTSGTISCTPYEPMSDLTGYIIIDWSGDYEGCNYLTMTETWGDEEPQTRTTYYYITDIIKDIGGKMRLYLRRDVLMTFRGNSGGNPSQIYNMDILVTRCAKQAQNQSPHGYNSMLEDPEVAISAQKYYREFAFKQHTGTALVDFIFTYKDYDDPNYSQYVLGVIG